MTIEQIERMHRAQPFQPFRVHMGDGRHIDVEHPEYLSRTPAGRTIMIATRNESFEVIDLLLVTSLEPLRGKKNSRQQR